MPHTCVMGVEEQ